MLQNDWKTIDIFVIMLYNMIVETTKRLKKTGGETDEKEQRESCLHPERNQQQSRYSVKHSHKINATCNGNKNACRSLGSLR